MKLLRVGDRNEVPSENYGCCTNEVIRSPENVFGPFGSAGV